MAKTNPKAVDRRLDPSNRLAGGYGPMAARQDPESLLRRAVLACLLWEDLAYAEGSEIVDNIHELVPQVPASRVAEIAIEARTQQKLRHVPLLLVREMARHATHKSLVGDLLPRIILRADELAEFLAIYWRDGGQPLSKQVKKGLAKAFDNFDAYQFAKYNRGQQVKLRDVLFLVHPHPGERTELFQQIAKNSLPTPDTWEVALSAGQDKKAAWTRLIEEGKLGALAFMRNLRNMDEVGVPPAIIRQGFSELDPGWLLPINFYVAAKAAPAWEREIETLMLQGLEQFPRLPGETVFIVDVSGSMQAAISARSQMTRLDVAAVMTLLAAETCEYILIFATSGDDWHRIHQTERLRPRRGFALCDEVKEAAGRLGGGGIFTRQALEHIYTEINHIPDRIIVFSDSQDCDHPGKQIPTPFGRKNYIVDVSSHSHGINYAGIWTAEISGWSEQFLTFIYALEGFSIPQAES
jgi:60 kDa SS-A/Ro ribonucleoprotein